MCQSVDLTYDCERAALVVPAGKDERFVTFKVGVWDAIRDLRGDEAVPVREANRCARVIPHPKIIVISKDPPQFAWEGILPWARRREDLSNTASEGSFLASGIHCNRGTHNLEIVVSMSKGATLFIFPVSLS